MKNRSNLVRYIVIGLVIVIGIPLAVKVKQSFSKQEKGKVTLSPSSHNVETVINSKERATLINEGVKLVQAGRFEESIKFNLEVLKKLPNSAILYNNIGFAYANLKQWDKSLVYLSKAIEIDPNFKLARNNYNWAKSELNK